MYGSPWEGKIDISGGLEAGGDGRGSYQVKGDGMGGERVGRDAGTRGHLKGWCGNLVN